MKKAISLILALVMVLALVACGGSSTETPAAEAPAAQAPAAEAPAETESGNPNEGRLLSMTTGVALTNVDPHEVTQLEGQYQTYQVYEGLIWYDEKTGEAYPRVAESWEFAEDDSYIDFKINPAVTFHNGDKVTAEDVVFSFDRILASAKYKSYLNAFESWEALDEGTVRLHTNGTTVIPLLKLGECKIVSKANVEAAGDQAFLTPEYSIGTGPYMYTEVDTDGVSITMAYDNYYRGRAAIDGIKWTYLTDSSTRLVGFEGGQFDIVAIPFANVEEFEATGKYQILMIPSVHSNWIGLSNHSIPDVRVRQAILYAIDNEAVMNAAVNGYGIVSKNWAEEGMVGGGVSFDDYYNYNPEKSRELLLEAGYTEAEIDAGIPMGNIITITTEPYATDAPVVQEMLRQAGMVFEVYTYEQANVQDLWYRRTDPDHMDLLIFGENVKVDSQDFYDRYIKRFDGSDPTHTQEEWGLPESKTQELGAAASSEPDPVKRNELWKEFWTAVKDDAYYYSMFHRHNSYVAVPELEVEWGVSFFHVYDWNWK
ncbi:MAG: ABC transporter substrate-binding protein [Ruminococcaceae bacterium]|nr:ABC transporter substrate-binding protein [Oscillospiraceae bacterium]